MEGYKFWHTFPELGIRGHESMEWLNWRAQILPTDMTGKTVLDVGGNEGYFSFLCERRGASRVVILDRLQGACQCALENFKFVKAKLNSKVEYRVGALEDLDFSEQFDYVICYGVYYHTENPMFFFRKLRMVTKEIAFIEGACMPQEQREVVYWKPIPEDPTTYWVPSIPCLLKMLLEAGFRQHSTPITSANRVLLRTW